MENFCKTYDVSRETYLKFELYCRSLLEWQQKFNLVSNASLADLWNRHFADSAQLFELIPSAAKTMLDIGRRRRISGYGTGNYSNEKHRI